MTPPELRALLAELGLSQTEAARRLPVNPRTMRRWIAGDSPMCEMAARAMLGWRRERDLTPPAVSAG